MGNFESLYAAATKALNSQIEINNQLQAELEKFREQKICKHSEGENLCGLLKPLNERGFELLEQINQLQAENKDLQRRLISHGKGGE